MTKGSKDDMKKGPRVWHKQHEKVLRNWGESAACYRYMHYKAHTMYKGLSMRMTLPIIIISTITGTANFAQESFPMSIQEYVPAMIGAMNIFAAILTTVLQFLKVNELMESHRVSSIHYGKLARNIRLELTLPITERAHDGGNMVEISKSEYDRLIEQSPPVPSTIIHRFERKFPEGSTTKFNRPEIMTIRSIELYDSEHEKQLTHQVVEAFRHSVNENSTKAAADIWNRDKHHDELVKEIQEIKGLKKVTNRNDLEEIIVEPEPENGNFHEIPTPPGTPDNDKEN